MNQDQSDWIQTLIINDHHIHFQLDTGAQANIISKHVFDKLNLNDYTSQRQALSLLHMAKLKLKTLECCVRSEKLDL